MKLKSLVIVCAAFAAQAVFAQAPPGGPSPEMRAALQAAREACSNDAKTLCADKQGREQFACLRENRDKVSAGCKDSLAKIPRPAGAQPPGAPPGK